MLSEKLLQLVQHELLIQEQLEVEEEEEVIVRKFVIGMLVMIKSNLNSSLIISFTFCQILGHIIVSHQRKKKQDFLFFFVFCVFYSLEFCKDNVSC
jgi:hypothetical protein